MSSFILVLSTCYLQHLQNRCEREDEKKSLEKKCDQKCVQIVYLVRLRNNDRYHKTWASWAIVANVGDGRSNRRGIKTTHY